MQIFTSRIDLLFMQWPDMVSHFQSPRARVHLSERGAFSEEQRFLGIHHDPVEVSFPVPMGHARLKCSEKKTLRLGLKIKGEWAVAVQLSTIKIWVKDGPKVPTRELKIYQKNILPVKSCGFHKKLYHLLNSLY